MVLRQLVVVDAVDNRQVRAVSRGRNDDALGASRQVSGSLVARCEDARAFQSDVNAQFLVRQRCRILDCRDLDRLATANGDRIALDLDLCRNLPWMES